MLQKRQLIVQLDPGSTGFSEYDASPAGLDVGEQQVQPSLVAAFALDRQGLTVGEPVDAREVNVRVAAEVHPGDRSASNVSHPYAHQDIGAAGSGVSLGEGRDIVGRDFKA